MEMCAFHVNIAPAKNQLVVVEAVRRRVRSKGSCGRMVRGDCEWLCAARETIKHERTRGIGHGYYGLHTHHTKHDTRDNVITMTHDHDTRCPPVKRCSDMGADEEGASGRDANATLHLHHLHDYICIFKLLLLFDNIFAICLQETNLHSLSSSEIKFTFV